MIGCRKSTDKAERFGKRRPLSANDAVCYRLRFKTNHDNVLCNGCWRALHPAITRPLTSIEVTTKPAAGEHKSPLSPTLASLDVTVLCADMDEAAAGLLSLQLRLPQLSSPRASIVVDAQPITRTVSEPLPVRVQCESLKDACDPRHFLLCTRPHLEALTQCAERTREVLSSTMAGDSWTQYNKRNSVAGREQMAESTWYFHLKIVLAAVERRWAAAARDYVSELVKRNESLVIAADGAWSHRSEANQHEFTMMNAKEGKVLASISVSKYRHVKGVKLMHTGNYIGSSKGMEAVGMTWALTDLAHTGLLPLIKFWVSDKDMSVKKILRENPLTSHIRVLYDPGHIKKNLVNNIKKILGESMRYKGIALRIGRFWLRLVKRAEALEGPWEERAEQARKWMQYIIPHYTGKCDGNCPHKEQYGRKDVTSVGNFEESEGEEEEDSDEEVEEKEAAALIIDLVEKEAGFDNGRRFLNLDKNAPNCGKRGDYPANDRKRVKAIAELIFKAMEDVNDYVHGFSTCSLERFHSQRTALTTKRIEFWSSWPGLLHFTALIHNEGYEMTTALLLAEIGVEIDDEALRKTRMLDCKRQWHKRRKEDPAYNQRKSQLALEGTRRKALEVSTSASLPSYKTNSPLYTAAELKEKATSTTAIASESEVKEGVTSDASVIAAENEEKEAVTSVSTAKNQKKTKTVKEGVAQKKPTAKRKIVYDEKGENDNPNIPTQPQPQIQTKARPRSKKGAKAPAKETLRSGADAVANTADDQPTLGTHSLTSPHIFLTVQMPNESKPKRIKWIAAMR
jgi:hypothetical protein